MVYVYLLNILSFIKIFVKWRRILKLLVDLNAQQKNCKMQALFQWMKHGFVCNIWGMDFHTDWNISPIISFSVLNEALEHLKVIIGDIEERIAMCNIRYALNITLFLYF